MLQIATTAHLIIIFESVSVEEIDLTLDCESFSCASYSLSACRIPCILANDLSSVTSHFDVFAQGDACTNSHGVYEHWLHPAKYRTQLCKDGAQCQRPVCFFAHSVSELRSPEYTCNNREVKTLPISIFCSFIFAYIANMLGPVIEYVQS